MIRPTNHHKDSQIFTKNHKDDQKVVKKLPTEQLLVAKTEGSRETLRMIRYILTLTLLGTGFVAGVGGPKAFAEEKSVTLINPQTDPVFRTFLDDALVDIMNTEVGRALCAHVLGGNTDLIEKHIGVTANAAVTIKSRCSSRPAKQLNYIHASNDDDLVKVSNEISTEKREYFFVFNLDKPWPMDSWTDPFGNKTFLILQKDWLEAAQKSTDAEKNHRLNILLYQMLAHELAIYFDPKHFPGGIDWDRLGLLSQEQVVGSTNIETLYSALMNPMIASALAFYRAFQIERMIMVELAAKKGFQLPAEYTNPNFSCIGKCLVATIKKIALRFSEQSATLLAISPQYRNRLYMSTNTLVTSHPDFETAVSLWPDLFFFQFKDIKERDEVNSWVLMLPMAAKRQRDLQNRINKFISTVLFPIDFAVLENQKIIENGKTISLLEFMARPLLSGYNVRLSTGPRVRIRGGDVK